MKISYNWLKDYCKHDLSVEELAESLTNAGLVVDTVNRVEDDFCLEVEVTSNRPDCLGFIGVAREVAAIVRGKLDIPDVGYDTIDENINDITSVTIEDNELCQRYTARIIKDVKIGPSPEWPVMKLRGGMGIDSMKWQPRSSPGSDCLLSTVPTSMQSMRR